MEKNKVLFVDDDESVLEYLQTALDLAGYEVVTAISAEQALKKVRETSEEFPVILSDIMMPGMNGIEFLKIIRKEFPDTIMVMLTAHATMELAIKSLNEGAFAFLSKPVNLDEVKATLRNANEKYRLIKENKLLVEELNTTKDYLETVVKNLIYVVVETDINGNIKKTNKVINDLLGYKEGELIGTPINNILTDEFKKTSSKKITNNRYVKDFSVAFISKSGKEIKLNFSGAIMRDSKNNVIGFLGTADK